MSTADRITDRVQLGLLLGMGGLAGAASFRHVHDLAADHGQPGWFAWAVAVSIEAMAIAAGLEIRRSHRVGRPTLFPTVALVAGIGLSLAAQVAQAEQSVWGWIVAATPAAAFLIVLKFGLRRLDTTPDTDPPAPVLGVPELNGHRPHATEHLSAYLTSARGGEN